MPAPADGSRDAPQAAVHALPATLGRVAAGAPDEEALVEAGIAELWAAFEADPRKSTKDRLVLHYAPLVKYVAGRVGTGLPSHVDVADLIQCGIFGLVDAIERFEPDRGRKFEVYAMQRIRGAILDELRSQDWVPRSVRSRAREIERAIERLEGREQRSCSDSELAARAGHVDRGPALDLRADRDDQRRRPRRARRRGPRRRRATAGPRRRWPTRCPTPTPRTRSRRWRTRETRRLLAEAVGQLAERDRTVVGLYYFENLTLAEIGRVLGVTESRVCQLHTRAVMRLRGASRRTAARLSASHGSVGSSRTAPEAEEQQRVEVLEGAHRAGGRRPAQAPVQARRDRAAAVPGVEEAQRVAASHRRPGATVTVSGS